MAINNYGTPEENNNYIYNNNRGSHNNPVSPSIIQYQEEDENSEGSLDESYYEDYEYEPQETSSTKYNIIICQKQNLLYDISNNTFINIYNFVYFRLKKFDYDAITDIYYNYINVNNTTLNNNTKNTDIEIGECHYLPSGYCVAILKTFWLRLIQRSYRNLYKKRKLCIKKRSSMHSLKHRELYGEWPEDCRENLTLRGMLSHLSRRTIA